MIDPTQWPIVKGKDLRALYVNNLEPEEIQGEMQERGWQVIDVRIMPCDTMTDRQKVVLAWLEGIRQQTITPGPKMLDFLDLEAQITGLKTGKQQTESKKVEKSTMDSLLDFNSHRARDSVGKQPAKQ